MFYIKSTCLLKKIFAIKQRVERGTRSRSRFNSRICERKNVDGENYKLARRPNEAL